LLSEIMHFTGLLRRAGIRVSPGEVLDLTEALKLTGTDREGFLLAMEATIIKQESQIPALHSLFELYWDERGKSSGIFRPAQSLAPDPKMEPFLFQKRLDHLKNFIGNEKIRLSEKVVAAAMPGGMAGRGATGHGKNRPPEAMAAPEKFVSAILDGSEEKMRQLVKRALDGISEDSPRDSELHRQLRNISGWAEGEELLKKICESKTGPDRWAVLERLNRFSEIAAKEIDRRIWHHSHERVLSRLNAEETYFNRLDYDQSREIKRKLVRLGKSLAVKPGYRYAPSPSGKVDLRKTAALAGVHGGIPVKLLFRCRQPVKPEIVILCDLSGSVANFSRFMMLLVSAIQDRFRWARSFAFVDAVEEVTPMIRGWDAEKKISEILRNTGIWQTGFSDYGEVWRQFEEEYGGVVGPRTTLIILGDARNNYKPDGIDHFAGITRKAKKVIWLNPAPKDSWDREDGIMSKYATYCHSVFQCSNIKQLERVVRDVFF